MPTALPADIPYGYVVGKYILAVADTTADVDHNPDATPAVGAVTFTPVDSIILSTVDPPTAVLPQKIAGVLDANGILVDKTGNPGVWLVAGQYTVSFAFTNVTVPSFKIAVTAANTVSNPVQLPLAVPLVSSPTNKFVVNEQVYLDTLAAKLAAETAAAVARQTAASLLSTVKAQTLPAYRPRVLLMGDSITDQNSLLGGEVDPGAASALVRRQDMIGYFTWANMALKHALVLQREAGKSGDGLQNMQARFDTDIAQVPGEIVVFFGGINSIGNVAMYPTAESLMVPIRDMAERAIASGKKVVLATLLTNEWNGLNGKDDYRQRVLDLNQLIRDYAASKLQVFLCDWHSAVVDDSATPTLTNSNWRPGMNFDTTHPGPIGASVMGRILADVLRPLLVPQAHDLIVPGDARPVSLNPTMAGTAGVRGAGSGLIATSWNGTQGATGGSVNYTGSLVWSKVARTDGNGEWQQLDLATPGGGWLYQRVKASDLFAAGSTLVESDGAGGYRFKTGTKLRADIEWERDNNWSGVTLLKGGVNYEGTGQTGYGEDMGNANITPTLAEAVFPTSGVLRTPTLYTPAGLAQILVSVRFSANTGTIRVGRMGVLAI